jgi:hypothetical protein
MLSQWLQHPLDPQHPLKPSVLDASLDYRRLPALQTPLLD